MRERIQNRLTAGCAGLWLPLTLLGLWQLADSLAPSPPVLTPGPLRILGALPRLWAEGLALDLAKTLGRLFAGLVVGGSLGLLTGYATGSSRTIRRLLEPTIVLIHPMPKVALFPVLLLLFGVGEAPRHVLVALAAFFPMTINVAAGMRQVPATLFEVARVFGASRAQTLREVIGPAVLPWVLVGLRIAVNVGFVATLTTELIAAPDGLGHRLWRAWETFRPEELYLVLAITGMLGFSIYRGIQVLAARGLAWRGSADRAI